MGFRALKKTLEALYTTKVNNRDRTSRGTTRLGPGRVVAFLFRTRMFIFTTSFPVTPTRSHNHPQLEFITPTDGRVKVVS